MAFSFSDIGALAQGAAAVAGLFQKQRTPPGYNEALESGRRASQFSAALDPSSPYFKKLEGEERDKINLSYADALKQLIVRNNRALARGSAGAMINPERRDETVSRVMARGFEDAQSLARDRARQYILSQVQANQMAAGSFNGVMGYGALNQQQNRTNQAGGMDAIGKILAELTRKKTIPADGKPSPLNGGQQPKDPYNNFPSGLY